MCFHFESLQYCLNLWKYLNLRWHHLLLFWLHLSNSMNYWQLSRLISLVGRFCSDSSRWLFPDLLALNSSVSYYVSIKYLKDSWFKLTKLIIMANININLIFIVFLTNQSCYSSEQLLQNHVYSSVICSISIAGSWQFEWNPRSHSSQITMWSSSRPLLHMEHM